MNKTRRRQIEEISERLSAVKDEVEALGQEERDYYDNMPEAFQSGDKGSAADAAASMLEEAVGQIEDALGSLATAVE